MAERAMETPENEVKLAHLVLRLLLDKHQPGPVRQKADTDLGSHVLLCRRAAAEGLRIVTGVVRHLNGSIGADNRPQAGRAPLQCQRLWLKVNAPSVEPP